MPGSLVLFVGLIVAMASGLLVGGFMFQEGPGSLAESQRERVRLTAELRAARLRPPPIGIPAATLVVVSDVAVPAPPLTRFELIELE